MGLIEALSGPSGAYLLTLLGVLGLLILMVCAIREKFKEVLSSFVVLLGAGLLGAGTGVDAWAVVSTLAFVAMFAFSVRRFIEQRGGILLTGVLFTGGALVIFVVRALTATFLGSKL